MNEWKMFGNFYEGNTNILFCVIWYSESNQSNVFPSILERHTLACEMCCRSAGGSLSDDGYAAPPLPRCYQSPAAPGLGGGGGNEPILSGCGHCCSVLMEAEWGQWLEFILSCFMSRWLINIGFSWYLEIFRDIAVVSSSLWRRGQHQ